MALCTHVQAKQSDIDFSQSRLIAYYVEWLVNDDYRMAVRLVGHPRKAGSYEVAAGQVTITVTPPTVSASTATIKVKIEDVASPDEEFRHTVSIAYSAPFVIPAGTLYRHIIAEDGVSNVTQQQSPGVTIKYWSS